MITMAIKQAKETHVYRINPVRELAPIVGNDVESTAADPYDALRHKIFGNLHRVNMSRVDGMVLYRRLLDSYPIGQLVTEVKYVPADAVQKPTGEKPASKAARPAQGSLFPGD